MGDRMTFYCTDCGYEKRSQKAKRRQLACPRCQEVKTFEVDESQYEERRAERRQNRRNRSSITDT